MYTIKHPNIYKYILRYKKQLFNSIYAVESLGIINDILTRDRKNSPRVHQDT